MENFQEGEELSEPENWYNDLANYWKELIQYIESTSHLQKLQSVLFLWAREGISFGSIYFMIGQS